MIKRWSKPFPMVVVPFFAGYPAENALRLAQKMEAKIYLLGLVQLHEQAPLSSGNLAARDLRRSMKESADSFVVKMNPRISVSFDAWQELGAHLHSLHADLVILDWDVLTELESPLKYKVLGQLGVNLAFVHGTVPDEINSSLLPMRGGPNAQQALRLALALPSHQITALHIMPADQNRSESITPFQGLERIIPSLPEIHYEQRKSDDPLGLIQEMASSHDLLIIGATARTSSNERLVSAQTEELLRTCACPIIMVKSKRPEPASFSGLEAVRASSQAISILVDKWFSENTFHSYEFDALKELLFQKQTQGVTISLAVPALNEEKTVGNVLSCMKSALMDEIPLLDEIVLVDSNSSDRTREIAGELGIPVYIHQQLLPQYGVRSGKGEALWKSLLVTRGDIVLWIDSDILNIHPRFAYGVLGPLLLDPRIQMIKGFYQRPLATERKIQPEGGGRVTELTARPLINLFYPELSGVIQPLSGEYGGRRKALENMTFYSGYGVELGLLIGMYEKYGLNAIAQVDLLERVHRNQSLQSLSKMSFVIMQTMLSRLEKRLARPLLEDINKTMKMIQYVEGAYYLDVQELEEQERPPMISLPEYAARYGEPDHT